MDFQQEENTNGTRWSWNVLPSTKLEASRVIVPVGCLYTPLKDIPNMPTLPYEPIVCRTCRSILNPFCRVDFESKMWDCPLCHTRNMFPPAYSGISPQALPAELYPQFSTIEYTLAKKAAPPVFLYVIDTCMLDEELQYMKDSIQMSLNLLPDDAIVGLIVLGTTVQVYELGFSECTKAYVFRGDKTPTYEQVLEQLGFTQRAGATPQQQQPAQGAQQKPAIIPNAAARFLLPLSDALVNMTSIIDELAIDPWPVKQGTRAKRATGTAVSIATSLMEAASAGSGGRILLFMGGPCTMGDGAVVGGDLTETIRLHNDIKDDKAPYFKKAVKFYQTLTTKLVQNGHTLDVFAAYLDQVGCTEMKSCCENTGGTLILTDTFDNPIFKESFKRFFKRKGDYLEMGLNGTIELQCSRDMKICGAIGPVTSLNKKSPLVSETEVGYGGTSCWKINALSSGTTVAFYFDVVNQQDAPAQSGMTYRFFQFVTAYQHSSGQFRLRVTTRALRWVPTQATMELAAGFDQETGAALVARLAVFKAETEYIYDVLRWLDRNLIRLMAKFGTYRKGDANSLSISENFAIFPQFMYHLRRSQFLRVFNSSPDETSFYRLVLNRETVSNSITMIQPTLRCYSFDKPPHPVLLDSVSVKPNVILLLDTFFHLLIHHGETIAAWREAGYQDQPKYENFKRLLELPREDAKVILKDRFPFPKYIECDQGSSPARILLTKINPSVTHHSNPYGTGQDAVIVPTDDASLQLFMDSLKKLAVSDDI